MNKQIESKESVYISSKRFWDYLDNEWSFRLMGLMINPLLLMAFTEVYTLLSPTRQKGSNTKSLNHKIYNLRDCKIQASSTFTIFRFY